MDPTKVVLVVVVVVAVLAAVTFGIAAWMGAGRAAQGGPPVGSVTRDDDDESPL